MARLIGDVVVLPQALGRWVVMNVFARTSLGLDTSGLQFLRAAEAGSEEELQRDFGEQVFPVWEVEYFSNSEGLLADPTRFKRDVRSWPDKEELNIVNLLIRLKSHLLLVDDELEYRSRFSSKKSLLDSRHLGNFHQQVGQHLLLALRQSPAAWWVQQKFTDDLADVRNNLYQAVQTYSLKRYFTKRFSQGDRVVDLGCGTGFYSNLIADTGATVLGVDPNAQYVELAQRHAAPTAQFKVGDIGISGALNDIPDESADFVFMSDALLFYFVAPTPGQVADIQILFRDIHRIMKPQGRFISVEPHNLFWLSPWLGDSDRPFTVFSEYSNKTFGVTPTISTLIQAYARGGFVVTWMEELLPDPSFRAVDPRAYHFAANFPLWQLYEVAKAETR